MAKTQDERKPPKVMPSEQARRLFSECLEAVGFKGERIVVSRFGKPLVAIVSMDDLEKIEGAA